MRFQPHGWAVMIAGWVAAYGLYKEQSQLILFAIWMTLAGKWAVWDTADSPDLD